MSFSQAFKVYLCSCISVPSLPNAKCAHCLCTIRSHQRLQRKGPHTKTQMHNPDTAQGPTPQRYCDKMTPSENITLYFVIICLRKFHVLQVQTETAVNLTGSVSVEGRRRKQAWRTMQWRKITETSHHNVMLWVGIPIHIERATSLFQAEKEYKIDNTSELLPS